MLLNLAFPSLPISPPGFAVVGMAGAVGGTTGAAITAIVMIFEMTLDYTVILPMTITVAISYGVRKFLCKESVYTLKLARRGHYIPEALRANFHLVRLARDVMDRKLMVVPASTSLTDFVRLLSNRNHSRYVLVEDHGKLLGLIEGDRTAEMMAMHGNGARVSEIAIRDYEVVTEGTTVFELLSKPRSRQVGLFVVAALQGAVSVGDIKGVISKERITDTMIESLGLFSDEG